MNRLTQFFSNTPDSRRYKAMSEGQRVEQPYHLRWLAPTVCRNDLAWIACALVSVGACAGLAVIYSDNRWPAALLVLGLPGVTLFNLRHPILVDAPAMALALATAVVARNCGTSGAWLPLIAALALLAGATKESAPLFAAAWAWSWVPLIGILAPLMRMLIVRPGPDLLNDEATTARTQLRTDGLTHRAKLLDPAFYLWPWGACLLGLAGFNLQIGVTLALAYAQLVIATDTTRLYMWAWPPLVAATCTQVPAKWWLPMVALHIANPTRGTGV